MCCVRTTDTWRPIEGWPNYLVSIDGKVLSRKSNRLLKQHKVRGYKQVALCERGVKTRHLVHRLMYVCFVGEIPTGAEIDHKNRNRSDNRLENLRLATKSQNHSNARARVGTSKYAGVCFHKTNKKWHVQVGLNGKQHHGGFYTRELDAALARDDLALQLHGEFASLNFPERYR